VFEDYIRDNVVSWFDWSKRIGLGVERMEDLILVTGCTLVKSWGVTAFVDRSESQEAEISLAVKAVYGGETFNWSKTHGVVAYHNCRFNPFYTVRSLGCVRLSSTDFYFVVSKESSTA
jgi:hypothetical protein